MDIDTIHEFYEKCMKLNFVDTHDLLNKASTMNKSIFKSLQKLSKPSQYSEIKTQMELSMINHLISQLKQISSDEVNPDTLIKRRTI